MTNSKLIVFTIGGSKGVPGITPPWGHNNFIFMQCSAKNLDNSPNSRHAAPLS